jgi:putative transposase
MTNKTHNHYRKSNRLQGYDYSKKGLYFITIITHERECSFGEIIQGKMVLNGAGKIANDYLIGISSTYLQTQLHEFIVMPNHIHCIIEIKHVMAIHESPGTNNDAKVGAIHESPLPMNNNENTMAIRESPIQKSAQQELSLRDQRRKMLISKIVGWYKMNTAKHINIQRKTLGISLWQRNYHDHIIRNHQSYQIISDYILNNPSKWKEDKFFKE